MLDPLSSNIHQNHFPNLHNHFPSNAWLKHTSLLTHKPPTSIGEQTFFHATKAPHKKFLRILSSLLATELSDKKRLVVCWKTWQGTLQQSESTSLW